MLTSGQNSDHRKVNPANSELTYPQVFFGAYVIVTREQYSISPVHLDGTKIVRLDWHCRRLQDGIDLIGTYLHVMVKIFSAANISNPPLVPLQHQPSPYRLPLAVARPRAYPLPLWPPPQVASHFLRLTNNTGTTPHPGRQRRPMHDHQRGRFYRLNSKVRSGTYGSRNGFAPYVPNCYSSASDDEICVRQ